MNIDLKGLGLTDSLAAEAAFYNGYYSARVCSQAKDSYQVICEAGKVMAEVSGKIRFAAKTTSDFPAVGDFVMIDRMTSAAGTAIINYILTRKSAFIRKAAGTANTEQVVASNIDTVFICMSLNNDFNLRRLERYLAIAWDSGAVPVIVLTKSDLCTELNQRLSEVEMVAVGTAVVVASATQPNSYSQLMPYITAGQTVAFIGSSGVGKSSLINCLLGDAKLDTSGLRNDDKGRHTTTRRELLQLPNGGLVIDTPGMRELGLDSADLVMSFNDIVQFAADCRFNDCTHNAEPGCAVQAAVSAGTLDANRVVSYQKLKKEARYAALNARQIETLKTNEMFSSVGGRKNFRRALQEKQRRK